MWNGDFFINIITRIFMRANDSGQFPCVFYKMLRNYIKSTVIEMLNRVFSMDCLEGMKIIKNKSIDMILCNLPYGTTACNWGGIIPFEPLWE